NFRLPGAPNQPGGTGSDFINASTASSVVLTGSQVNVTALGASPNGTYHLIQAANGAAFTGLPVLASIPAGFKGVLAINGSNLDLTVTLNQNFVWSGNATPNTNWSTGGNWVGGVAPVGNADEILVFPATANVNSNNDLNVAGLFFGQIQITG